MERPVEKVVEQGDSSLTKVLATVGAMAALAASSMGTERCGLAKGISLAALSACLVTQVKAWRSKVPIVVIRRWLRLGSEATRHSGNPNRMPLARGTLIFLVPKHMQGWTSVERVLVEILGALDMGRPETQ